MRVRRGRTFVSRAILEQPQPRTTLRYFGGYYLSATCVTLLLPCWCPNIRTVQSDRAA